MNYKTDFSFNLEELADLIAEFTGDGAKHPDAWIFYAWLDAKLNPRRK
jgi:hypothetical protein